MNTLANLEETLLTGRNEIHIEESIRVRALRPVERMLNFAASEKTEVFGLGNA